MDKWMDGWTDGWMDKWINGWMDGWMNEIMNIKYFKYFHTKRHFSFCWLGGFRPVRESNLVLCCYLEEVFIAFSQLRHFRLKSLAVDFFSLDVRGSGRVAFFHLVLGDRRSTVGLRNFPRHHHELLRCLHDAEVSRWRRFVCSHCQKKTLITTFTLLIRKKHIQRKVQFQF